jgi:hypothetical protein
MGEFPGAYQMGQSPWYASNAEKILHPVRQFFPLGTLTTPTPENPVPK